MEAKEFYLKLIELITASGFDKQQRDRFVFTALVTLNEKYSLRKSYGCDMTGIYEYVGGKKSYIKY